MHAPFAGGRLDASDAYMMKHGGSLSVKRTLDSHFVGYLVDDYTHKGSNLDDATWKLRWTPKGAGYPSNIIGYGKSNPFIAPLAKPQTLIGLLDRRQNIWNTGGPFVYFLMHTFWEWMNALGTGDLYDGYWYNNSEAIGYQLYPKGIHKYFDMFSMDGLWYFTFEWLIVMLLDLLMPFTLFIPIDVWIGIANLSFDGMERWFLYYLPWGLGINTLYGIYANEPSEGQWGMLWN